MIDGSEFLNAWAMAATISLEREEDSSVEAAVTTTEAADDEGEDVEAVETASRQAVVG